MRPTSSNKWNLAMLGLVIAISCLAQEVSAGQGCPFDDGSCQEYCGQQGCHMGYCGHFAWIQCICRKCGDEWNWYDKVHYNPDKAVNQTELDSLKLNGTAPIILTTNNQQQQQQQQVAAAKATPTPAPAINSDAIVIKTTTTKAPAQRQQQQQQATLTTLLIPDLSDKSSDANDIPDENSEKFLDYLAKNHERLTAAARDVQPDGEDSSQESEETTGEPSQQGATGGPGNGTGDEETVEIQISSSDNQTSTTTTSTTTASPTAAPAASTAQAQPATTSAKTPDEPATVTSQQSATKRLLRLAVIERNSEEIV